MFKRLAIGLIALVALQLPGLGPSQAAWEFKDNDLRDCPGHWCRAAQIYDCARQAFTSTSCLPAPDARGVYRFDYWINPTFTSVPKVNPYNKTSDYDANDPEHFRRAVAYAARTWEYAIPNVRFRFLGYTDAVPYRQDGLSVIAPWPSRGQGETANMPNGEFDIAIAQGDWEWLPCRFRCTPFEMQNMNPADGGGVVRGNLREISGLLVHELGHALGLGHPADEAICATMLSLECTADPQPPDGLWYNRYDQSPAYGELLAMRWLYGYKCPPKPAGYVEADPNGPFTPEIAKKRSWVPWRYRQVCPTIRIGYP